MSSKKSIICIASNTSDFIFSDIDFLANKYEVFVDVHSWNNKKLTPLFFIQQLFFLIKQIKKAEAILISFGGYWSFLPTLVGKWFNKPTYIILHGTDCASIPPLNYGSLRKKMLRYFIKKSYQNATALLPVSSSLVHIKNTYYSDDKYSYQGFKHFYPKLNVDYFVINNGLDVDFWNIENYPEKNEKSFISVFSDAQFILKGGDIILEVAKFFPDYSFYIVGCKMPLSIGEVPKNVSFLGKIAKEELRSHYGKAQFHFQLSIFEGFGLALCEAMLCCCIPIVSSVNILPEIVGENGFVLDKRDVELLKKTLENAIALKDKKMMGEKARNSIVKRYSLKNREDKLISIIEKGKI
ncbi:MAG: glycosyltransferase family 4 protein [Flavobacteriales bacterium]|nr:glycosyltransferase family 4 protein [Flavobacteriales bacterium]MCW8912649.1 glycosyltransferase family 4 protein [Flavobacteriales bacterium]MCW8938254.1 glycosyltransferase family 4 protein [Flavobacteriales bacterium]MCW8939264.1 glycosyltransferase family 4 protein [Flavobacteriales bacterium]MCW8969103.1 glycosyltransferase family 4 protein [Flavobacteriales bacterium]